MAVNQRIVTYGISNDYSVKLFQNSTKLLDKFTCGFSHNDFGCFEEPYMYKNKVCN